MEENDFDVRHVERDLFYCLCHDKCEKCIIYEARGVLGCRFLSILIRVFILHYRPIYTLR